MMFMMSCAFVTVEDFTDSCRQVYFATDEYSTATFIIVNAGLYYLFQERSDMDESKSEEYLRYHYLCRDNLETALANLPLLLPPRKETIEALLLGVSGIPLAALRLPLPLRRVLSNSQQVTYTIEISKLTLGWQLNSAAAAMCQTLGWHRLQVTEDQTNDSKSAIFWFCYMLDKGLSLRFGRTSVMQDWDISVPRNFGNISMAEPWTNVINVWIRTGSILGETYEHLYSPAALARQPEQRIETARLLVAKMKQLWRELEELSATLKHANGTMADASIGGAKDKEMRTMTLDMILKSGEVSHLASLTLIYRAIPSAPGFPSTFNAECIEAARMAFKCHEECMNLTSSSLYAKAGYLHWYSGRSGLQRATANPFLANA